MKNILIFVFLVVCSNIIGQGNGSPYNFHVPTSLFIENFQITLNEDVSYSFSSIPQNILQRHYKPVAFLLFSPIQLRDSVYTWQWDPFLKDWLYQYRINQFIYDDKKNLLSATQQKFDGLDWLNNSKFTIIYNEHNKPISLTLQIWDGFWENDMQFIYTYDAYNNTTSELYQEWYESVWHDIGLYTLTYDAHNNLTSESSQYWNETGWFNEYKEIYTYDENNYLVSHITQNGYGNTWQNSSVVFLTYDINYNLINELYQFWNGINWQNSSISSYTYDLNNNLSSQLGQHWDDSTWQNSQLFTYGYDILNHQISELEQSWDGNAWLNYFQYLFTYDLNNNQTSDLTQKWIGAIWQNVQQNTHAYDDDHYIISETSKHFNATGTAIASGDSTYNYYYTITGANDLEGDNRNILVYPNPSSGKFTITTKIQLKGIQIYSPSGAKIYAVQPINSQNNYEINFAGYAKGIYIIIMHDGSRVYARKIILQ